MPLYVNAADWNDLSEQARDSITRMLQESQMLKADEVIQVDPDQPSLRHERAPSLQDPRIAQLLQQAAQTGMEAVGYCLLCPPLSSRESELLCRRVRYPPTAA